jgi:hypothetical protein
MAIEIMNQRDPDFPAIEIGVMNKNDTTFPSRFDGTDYDFPPNEGVTISPEAALFIFGVESRARKGNTIKLTRDKKWGKRNASDNSFYDMARLAHGIMGKDAIQYFDNFEFVIVEKNKRLSPKAFHELKLASA